MTISNQALQHIELVSKDKVSTSNAAHGRNSPIKAVLDLKPAPRL
jgi:hypothetical protein